MMGTASALLPRSRAGSSDRTALDDGRVWCIALSCKPRNRKVDNSGRHRIGG